MYGSKLILWNTLNKHFSCKNDNNINNLCHRTITEEITHHWEKEIQKLSLSGIFFHVRKEKYCHRKQTVNSFPEKTATCKFWAGNKIIRCFIALFLNRSEYNNSFVILGLDKGVHIAVTHTYSNHPRPSIFMAAIISQITALFPKSIPNFHKI